MVDIVIIVAGNSYATQRAVINCFDATIDFPGLVEGARVTPVVAALMAEGFTLVSFDGSDSVTTYLFTRETVSDPLAALRARLNTAITVTTEVGTVSGLLVLVGSDVIEIIEPTGDIVLIPIFKIQSWM